MNHFETFKICIYIYIYASYVEFAWGEGVHLTNIYIFVRFKTITIVGKSIILNEDFIVTFHLII